MPRHHFFRSARALLHRLAAAALAACLALPALAAEPVIIDVRTPAEYAQGHISGALNLPYDTIAAHITAAAPDKAAPVILYCRSGRRSAIALETLKGAGYTHAENYGGLEEARKRLEGR